MLLSNKVNCYIILDKIDSALLLTQKLNNDYPVFSKVWYAIGVGYLRAKKYNKSYFNEVKQLFANATLSEKQKMLNEQSYSLSNGFSFMLWANSDTGKLVQSFEGMIPGLGKTNKTFTLEEMEAFVYAISTRKVMLRVKVEQNRFVKKLEQEVAKETAFYKTLWEKKEYNFQSLDHPTQIVAANFQAFDKVDFPAANIWVNPKETFNAIDDDGNGIVDDVNGFMFNPENHYQKVPVSLDREVAKTYFKDSAIKRVSIYNHGTMSVELMLKGNPHVQIIGMEHWQYDSIWTKIQSKFNTDIDHNRTIIDSLVELRINCWKAMVNYCKEKGVKVAQINSMGFVLNGPEWNFGTGTGMNDSLRMKYKMEKFWQLVYGLNDAFSMSPSTLFVIAGGNEKMDNTTNKYLNMSVKGPNLLTVGALDKNFRKASYSNYGKDIDVYAPAHFPLKSKNVRTNESSGTSAAAPVVCNLALKLLGLFPSLTTEQLKNLIIKGADKDLYEPGINSINPAKTVKLIKYKWHRRRTKSIKESTNR
jgi:hypothetical protein